MKVGVIGSGVVGRALGSGFLAEGDQVMMGTRQSGKLDDWSRENPTGRVGSPAEAAAFGEVVVLAVKGAAAFEALRGAGAAQGSLDGKVVIDTTNPIADSPPIEGVLTYFTSHDESLMEKLQAEFPAVRFVKAFNSVGHAHMVGPEFSGGTPTMFICGGNEEAKETVTRILTRFGWETADMGSPAAARAIEPLAMLWCIPGIQRNEWNHAFKLLTG